MGVATDLTQGRGCLTDYSPDSPSPPGTSSLSWCGSGSPEAGWGDSGEPGNTGHAHH